MIHVNVRADREHPTDYIVETSTDGAGWKVQYTCALADRHDRITARHEAEGIARIMGVAWSYAGVEWRGTSCGYAL